MLFFYKRRKKIYERTLMDFPSIIWFRQDLRLKDNPAFTHAIHLKRPILAVYIDDTQDPLPAGQNSRWWLHHSLISLQKSLQKHSIPLVLRRGQCAKILKEIIKESGAKAIFWNRLYRPYCYERDTSLQQEFLKMTLDVESFVDNILVEPEQLLRQSTKTPYKVYGPFWKALTKKLGSVTFYQKPKNISGFKGKITSEPLLSWNLQDKKTAQQASLKKWWKPGEDNAQRQWQKFLKRFDTYQKNRNFPGINGTSELSPYLQWGEISVRQLWKDIEAHQFSQNFSEGVNLQNSSSALTYLKELGWRDFFQYLLYHFPDMKDRPLQEKFEQFQWEQKDQFFLEHWQQGWTGYPIVDAGMRQLAVQGWMHNRVRLITASFLVKHLLVDWRKGEQWFWQQLVDADHGNNVGNWQWVAGCGADVAPYFRIFNPILQSQKFDFEGIYIKKWVPELEKMPKKYIHSPWKAPTDILKKAQIVLGQTYPLPLVDHEKARTTALSRYKALSKSEKRAAGTKAIPKVEI